MIAQLRGTLADKRPNQVLVDVGGVGYLVHIPVSTFYALGELHSNVTLLIHTQVREDAISLYGFLSSREKHLFELLISASGVGPVLARSLECDRLLVWEGVLFVCGGGGGRGLASPARAPLPPGGAPKDGRAH